MTIDEPQPQDSSSYGQLIDAGDWESVFVRDERRFLKLAHQASLRFPALQEADCQDIVQNTVRRIYEIRATFDPSKAPYEAWSYKICTNQIFNTLRELRRNGKLREWQSDLSEETPEEWLNRVSEQPEYTSNVESRLIARDLLERLDPDDCRILVSNRCDGLSVEELAQQYGVAPAAMKKRIYRAGKKLAALMTDGGARILESVATQ